MGGVAAADSASCGSIVDSGPGSTNYVYCQSHNSSTVTCDNNIDFTNTNSQSAGSGNSGVNGNTSGGSAGTGSAGTDNSTSTTLNAGCAPQVAAATPTTPATAVVNTPAAVASTPAAAKPAATPVASLPDTGSNTVLDSAAVGVAVVGGTMAVSQLGVAAYRRFALK
jgi:hypothetical protein